jgi:fatty acid desaturase
MANSVAVGSQATQRPSRSLAPLEAVGVVFQALVMIYVGIAGGILDLISHAGRALLPIDRINAQLDRVARFLAPKVLADERDWPILPVLAAISVLAPASVALQIFLMGRGVPWIVACLIHHAVLLGAGGRRFAKVFSIKHNEAHRPKGFFRGPGRRFLRRYTEALAMVFYGNVFGLDYIHHVKVHHSEDGGPEDPQNTHGYDRTSTWDFLHYMGVRHLVVTLGIATPRWLLKHQRTRDARIFFVSLLAFYAMVGGLLWFNWRLALVVAVGPLLLSNVFAATSSWLQHSFESRDSTDPIANTITVLAPTDFLNEGYHLAHHYRSGTHWTELPQRFEEWRARNPAAQPIVIEGVDYIDLAVLLYVRRRVDLVAEHWKPLAAGDATFTLEARTALLRERLGGA